MLKQYRFTLGPCLLGCAFLMGASCGGGEDNPDAGLPVDIVFSGSTELNQLQFNAGPLPKKSPVTIDLTLLGTAKLTAKAIAISSGPASSPTLSGVPDGGLLGLDAHVRFTGKIHAMLPERPVYQGLVTGLESLDVQFVASAAYDPFLIGSQVVATATLPAAELPPVALPGGLAGQLKIVLEPGNVLSAVYSGVCASVSAGPNAMGQYKGAVSLSGTIKLKAHIELTEPTDKTYSTPVIEVPVNLTNIGIDLGTKPVPGGGPPMPSASVAALNGCALTGSGGGAGGGGGSQPVGGGAGGGNSNGGGAGGGGEPLVINYHTLYVHGRLETPVPKGWDYWSQTGDSTEVQPGINAVPVNWDGRQLFENTNIDVRSAFDTYCTGEENWCYVVCHSTGCPQTEYALAMHGNVGGVHRWNITWVAAAGSVEGGSELAKYSIVIPFVNAFVPLDDELIPPVMRQLYPHDQTQGVIVYMFVGAGTYSQTAALGPVMPGDDDGAVSMHSAAGVNNVAYDNNPRFCVDSSCPQVPFDVLEDASLPAESRTLFLNRRVLYVDKKKLYTHFIGEPNGGICSVLKENVAQYAVP